MGLFDGLFGGDKPDGAGGGSSLGSNVNGLFSDPIFMSGLQILSNGMTRRPISQARSPLEGVPGMLAKLGEGQQELEGLRALAVQAGYTPEQAAKFTTPAQIKIALEQKTQSKSDAKFETYMKSRGEDALFGGGVSAAPSASPAAKVASGGEEAAPSTSSAPASFGGSQQEFIASLMPKAIEASKATGVDPRIIVAQAALESGWGKSAPGNNLFGIKSHGQSGGNTLATTEVIDGKPVRVNDSFRAYASPEDSVKGYADFINTNPRYGALKSAQGLDEQIAALQKSGYATDPNYGAKIKQIAAGISLPGAPQQTAQSPPQGQGQGLSRLSDSQVQPPAPGVPVASRGPGGLAYAAPQADGFSSPLSSVLLNPQEMSAQAVQRGTPPGDPASYAPTAPARPLPAGVDPASLAQPAVQQGRVQVASSDPNFVPGGAETAAVDPARLKEAQKAAAQPLPASPEKYTGTTARELAKKSLQRGFNDILWGGYIGGDRGKAIQEEAKARIDVAKEYLKPSELEKQLDLANLPPGLREEAARNALPNNQPSNTREYDFYAKQEKAAGRTPKSFDEWDVNRRRASATNINTTEGMENARVKARIQIDTKQAEEVGKLAMDGMRLSPLLNQVEKLAKETPEGFAGPLAAGWARTMSGLGFEVSDRASNAEALQSITQRLIPLVREPGPTSEKELEVYMRAVPGLMQSKDGRLKIVATTREMMQRANKIAKVYRDNLGAPDLYEKLAELDKPMFSDDDRKSFETMGSAASPSAAPSAPKPGNYGWNPKTNKLEPM